MRVPDFLVFDRNSSAVDQSRVLVPRADRPSLLRRGARTKFQRNSSFTPPSARHVDRHRQAESMPPNAYSERFERFEGSVTLSDGPLEPSPGLASPLSSPYAEEPAEVNFTPRPVERRLSAEEVPRMESPIPARMEDEVQALGVGQNVSAPEPVDHTAHELEVPARPPSSERKSSWSWGFKRSKSEQVRSDIHVDKVHPPAAEPVPRPRPSVSTETSSNTTATPTAPGKKGFGLSSLFSRKNSSSKVQPAATTVAPSVPKDFQLNRINQNRLPIHIERAIYRLSHSKLANPRRPLHEQVLISNLMFWYLSLVSSPQTQLQAAQQQQSQPNGSTPANKAKKFVPAGKKGKRRPQPNSSSPRPQQQQQHGRPTSPSNAPLNSSQPHKARAAQKHDNGNAALHPLMGPSTGFVVPENYLKPGSKGMAGVGRRSSLSDSDEDEDDTGQSDSSSDEEVSNSNVTMKARAAAATKHRASNDTIPNHTRTAKRRGSDDVPLAMYRKGKA
ncbi:hypothetical protein BJV82DRAFT_189963 [Fennellomyces sp. T-0311]|nr:hypothetical protein BJV82DRAFT_189963 [Fennellomyces sp. T-0311]